MIWHMHVARQKSPAPAGLSFNGSSRSRSYRLIAPARQVGPGSAENQSMMHGRLYVETARESSVCSRDGLRSHRWTPRI